MYKADDTGINVYMCSSVDKFDFLSGLVMNEEHSTLFHHEGESGDESDAVRLLRVMEKPNFLETMAGSCGLSGPSELEVFECTSVDKVVREINGGCFIVARKDYVDVFSPRPS